MNKDKFVEDMPRHFSVEEVMQELSRLGAEAKVLSERVVSLGGIVED